MISPLNILAISNASFDFPVPVAPKITTTGTLEIACLAAMFTIDSATWRREVLELSSLSAELYKFYFHFVLVAF